MTSALPLPDHLWNNALPELQSAILALVQIEADHRDQPIPSLLPITEPKTQAA